MCAVLVGFYRRAIFNSLIVLVIVGFFSRGWVLIALPATAVLVSPLAGETIFNFQANTNLFGAGVACAFLGQACVGAIMLAAAARKFRQPDRPAFSISLAFVLLGVWVALNLAGMLQWGAFEPRFLRFVLGRRMIHCPFSSPARF